MATFPLSPVLSVVYLRHRPNCFLMVSLVILILGQSFLTVLILVCGTETLQFHLYNGGSYYTHGRVI